MKNLSKLQAKSGKFYALNQHDQWILLKVFFVLVIFYGMVAMLPFRYFLKPAKATVTPEKAPSAGYMNSVVWAIRVVSTHVPLNFTCLVQALGARWLLQKYAGLQVHIGVQKSTIEGFTAHAWVTSDNRIILGKQADHTYTPILEWS